MRRYLFKFTIFIVFAVNLYSNEYLIESYQNSNEIEPSIKIPKEYTISFNIKPTSTTTIPLSLGKDSKDAISLNINECSNLDFYDYGLNIYLDDIASGNLVKVDGFKILI